MGRALVLGLMVVGAASALGQGKGPLAKPPWAKATPPKGWNELPGLAKSVSTTLEQSRSFGEVRGRAGAQAFAEPGKGAFYVSWLVADKPAPDKAAALRSALDAVRHSRIASSPAAASTEELKYTESVNENMAEAVLEWRHVSNETMSLVRAFAWLSPAGAPRLLKGECVASTTAGKPPPEVETACRAALAALMAEVPPGERGSLADLPAGAAAPPPAPEEIVPASPTEAGAQQPPPDKLGVAPPGDQKILYTGPPPAAKSDSMRKWFVILGGLLLVVGLYLTYRARFRNTAPSPAPAAPPDPDPDPDSASDPVTTSDDPETPSASPEEREKS